MTTQDTSDFQEGQLTPDSQQGKARLQGNMGIGELVMSVLAFSAPLTTVAGFIPGLLIFDGHSAPAMYLMVTALLLVFSVGFVAMGRKVPNPGGFYAFITAGLGRSAGLGSAALAIIGYLGIGFFGPPFFAVTMNSYVTGFGGPEISWLWYGLALIALTTALAYRRIDLSARVLTVVMGLEIIAVIIFNVAAFLHGGPSGDGVGSLELPNLASGTIGVAILLVVSNFLGFEATVIYREEVKGDPAKTIPRATYIAVGAIGVFYAIAAAAFLAYLGADNAQAAAEADAAGLFNSIMTDLVGKTVVDIITVLLITSVIAAMLSIHNVSARYLFSLGTDNVLPKALGKVHPSHRSPYVSAAVVGALWAAATLFFVVIGMSPNTLYVKAVGIGALAIVLLLFATSIAVVVYFVSVRKSATEPQSLWRCYIAPIVSFFGLGFVTYLAISNYSALIGDEGTITTVLLTITFAIPVLGAIYAVYLKKGKPDVYQRIGRQQV